MLDSFIIIGIIVTITNLPNTIRQNYNPESISPAPIVYILQANDINSVPSDNIGFAIRGKLSGVRVRANSGEPGDNIDILLRGATSILGNNSPIIVKDGIIILENLQDIDISGIKFIKVLKGSASATKYGAQGAAGAIEITSEDGSNIPDGETYISLRSEFGMTEILPYKNPVAQHHPYRTDGNNWLDSNGKITDNLDNRGFGIEGYGNGTIAFQDNKFIDPLYNNLNHIFESNLYSLSSFNIGSRKNNTSWNINLNFSNDQGIFRYKKALTKNSINLNLSHKINDRINITYSNNISRIIQNRYTGLYKNYNIFQEILNMEPIKNEIGLEYVFRNMYIPFEYDSSHIYPELFLKANEISDNRLNVSHSFKVEAILNNNFKFGGRFYQKNSTREYNEYNPFGGYNDPRQYSSNLQPSYFVYLDESDYSASAYYIEGKFTKNKVNFSTNVQLNLDHRDESGINTGGEGFFEDGVKSLNNIWDKSIDSHHYEFINSNFLINSKLDYNNILTGEFTFSRFGSSTFGDSDHLHNYCSIRGSYNITGIPGISSNNPVNHMKLNLAHGTAGTLPGFLDKFERYSSFMRPRRLAMENPRLKPGHSSENELGLNVGIFNRVSLDLAYSATTTKDQLMNTPIFSLYGHSNQTKNAGTLRSKTLEVSAQGIFDIGRNFLYTTQFHIARTRQRITELLRQPFKSGSNNLLNISKNSEYGEFYGKAFMTSPNDLPEYLSEYQNHFQVNDEGLLVYVGDGNTWKDGISKELWGSEYDIDGRIFKWGIPIEKLNDEGISFFPLGRAVPDFCWSWINNIKYKNLNLYTLLDAEIGGKVFNGAEYARYFGYNPYSINDQYNKPEYAKKPTVYNKYIRDSGNHSYFVRDGSFIKLREVSLSYDINPKIFNRSFEERSIRKIRIGINCRNLLTWSGYNSFDPEVGGGFFSPVDDYQYPHSRQITGFFEIEF